MNMHISNANNKVHELAPPTCLLLLSKNFNHFPFFNVVPSLSIFHVQLLLLPMMYLHIFVPTSPPLSSISIKGVLLIEAKTCFLGRWLRLVSCIFYGHHLNVGMTQLVDTTHRIFDLDTNLQDTSPLCDSMGHPFDKLELL